MNNKYLLSFYAHMLSEDYEQDFNKFKYLGILENPEGFKELERHMNPQQKFKEYREAQPYESGIEADKHMVKPSHFKSDDGIELG